MIYLEPEGKSIKQKGAMIMAIKTITVTITQVAGLRYSVSCLPASRDLMNNDTVQWNITGVPAGYSVKIELPDGVDPSSMTGTASGGVCTLSNSVKGPRTPTETRAEELYKGDYQITLPGSPPLTLEYPTSSKLMIDKGGPPPPPDNNACPRNPQVGEDHRPVHRLGASG